MRTRPSRHVNRTVRTSSSTAPMQKYRFSIALCKSSSAMIRFGSKNALCANENSTPCFSMFERSLSSSHSKLGSLSLILTNYHIFVWMSRVDRNAFGCPSSIPSVFAALCRTGPFLLPLKKREKTIGSHIFLSGYEMNTRLT
jgi:hypothetical protein